MKYVYIINQVGENKLEPLKVSEKEYDDRCKETNVKISKYHTRKKCQEICSKIMLR